MKKRIVSLLLSICLLLGVLAAAPTVSAYSTDYPNTYRNTGDQRTDVVEVAKTQVGYQEDSSGTKYGAWWQSYLNSSYNYTAADWCAMFVLWCEKEAGCEAGYVGGSALCSAYLERLQKGTYGNTAYAFGSGYTPRPGDIVFIGPQNGSVSHIGLIASVSDTKIKTIEGNYSNKVSSVSYDLATGKRESGSRYILYYGVINYKNDPTSAQFNDPPEQEKPEVNAESSPVDYWVKITANSLNIRASASTASSSVGSLVLNNVAHIKSEAKDAIGNIWGELENGGWISLAYSKKTDKPTESEQESHTGEQETPQQPPEPKQPEPITVTVTALSVFIRSDAGTSNPTCGSLVRGQKVTITEIRSVDTNGTSAEWGHIQNGGWFCLTYSDYSGSTAPGSEPETQPEPTSAAIPAVVNTNNLRIRKDATTASAEVALLAAGTKIEITERKTAGGMEWGKLADGRGWVCMSYGYVTVTETKPEEPTVSPEEANATVNTSGLRIRKDPTTASAQVGTLNTGARIRITETKSAGGMEWGKLADGRGWVCMSYGYVTKDAETPSAPDTPNTPATAEANATVNTTGLRIRSGAGTSTAQVGTLNTGARIRISEEQTVNGVLWGRLADGRGWVCMSYGYVVKDAQNEAVENPTGGTEDGVRHVTANSVNIRSGAGMGASVLRLANKGDAVTVVSTETADGRTWGKLSEGGWICMDYVA